LAGELGAGVAFGYAVVLVLGAAASPAGAVEAFENLVLSWLFTVH